MLAAQEAALLQEAAAGPPDEATAAFVAEHAPEPPAPAPRGRGARRGRGGAAEAAGGAEPAPAAEEPRRPQPGPPAAPAAAAPRPSVPAVEAQQLVLSGGSPFLRVIGFLQRPGGEPLPGFDNIVISKMASHPLPTEPGAYEFRFKVRNGIGDFELKQRTPKGTAKNERSFEVDPHDALQTYRITVP